MTIWERGRLLQRLLCWVAHLSCGHGRGPLVLLSEPGRAEARAVVEGEPAVGHFSIDAAQSLLHCVNSQSLLKSRI